MNKSINSIVFAIAIIGASFVLGYAIINRNSANASISVTGLGKSDFKSDLIVWEGEFSAENRNLQQAYLDIEKDKKLITDYLNENGIDKSQIIFSAVSTSNKTKPNYSTEGRYLGEEFIGYRLSQRVQIESKEVEKVEEVSREITELLNKGVQFYSYAPRYYYTKLADLKIEMISKASADARLRAENIAKNSGSKLGDLISAQMGVFQITGQNSAENYSWGGTFNTSSKFKTASITVKLSYKVR